MIIEVDINTLEVRVNGRNVGTTTTEKIHAMRDFARKYCNPKAKSTYYTVIGGKIASQHDISDATAHKILDYIVGTPLMRMAKEGDPIANFLLRG